jgi:hypothetical protein
MDALGSIGKSSVKNSRTKVLTAIFRKSVLTGMVSLILATSGLPQAVPYARSFPKSAQDVEAVLKELQAYSGQKLPIVDGFVAAGDESLNQYERAFYQFSIDLLPGTAGGTIVRVTAKITAWHVDPAPWKSGYQILPSNGRLELDLLDRLGEKFGEKPATAILRSQVQAPTPKINLPIGSPGASLQTGRGSDGAAVSSPAASDDVDALRVQREAEEKRRQRLNDELQTWEDVKRNQAHPRNLVVVKKTGTPLLARPAEDSHVLFSATADDEFEFLDATGPWIHVQISGLSRGYIRRSSLDLPDFIADRLNSPNGSPASEKAEAFRLAREETGTFPGDWQPLRGKSVKIYTVQPTSQDPKETGAQARLSFASMLLKKYSTGPAGGTPPVEGLVIIFDSADGGIVGSTLLNAQRLAAGSLTQEDFWKLCYLDPPNAFWPAPKP